MVQERYHGIDTLRAFAMLLGVVLHAQMPFVKGFWIIEDPNVTYPDFWNGLFLYIHSFRMPLFFILSGFFTQLIFEKKGLKALILSRCKRVLFPFGLCFLTVLPLTFLTFIFGIFFYIDSYDLKEVERTVLEWGKHAKAKEFAEATEDGFHLAHLWFLWFLIIFNTAYVALAPLVKKHFQKPLFSISTLNVALVTSVALQHQMKLPIGPDTALEIKAPLYILAYYACFFYFGTQLHQPLCLHWLSKIPRPFALGTFTLATAAMLMIIANILNHGFIHIRTIEVSTLEALACWLICLSLITLAFHHRKEVHPKVRYLSDASYWIYLIHIPILFLLQGALSTSSVNPFIKFLFYFSITLAITLLSYRLMVRYTWVGRMLNGKKVKAL